MSKVRIGVVGAYRGATMINYCKRADNAEIVAICDNNQEVLDYHRQHADGHNITFYDNYEDFLKHDMDAVVLANFANEHAPFAIKAMKAGKHVYSEVLPVQTMKEAVELVETVEETGLIYAYGENYCYMPVPYEMKKLYKEGVLGEFEYGEGEYIHNCEKIWPGITYGDPDHWRNIMYSTFYCTHSLGPIIHITGLRPVSVVGFEGTKVERMRRVGAKSGAFAIEMVTLENGGIVKSVHGSLYMDSIWYSLYGSKGRIESGREDTSEVPKERDARDIIYVNCDDFSGEYGEGKLKIYRPVHELAEQTKGYAHGGSDFYIMHHFVEKIKGNKDADIIDVYEALDMFLPGLFAYRSALEGGKPMAIPNLRNKEERELWRNDTACTDPKVAGDMLLPTSITGTPEVEEEVYERMKQLWAEDCKKEDSRRSRVFSAGTVKK